VVRVQRGDDTLGRVVEQYGADADHDAELVGVRGAEEGLVLADQLAFVVEDSPAAADPAWIDDGRLRVVDIERSRFGLDLFLDFAAKAIRVAEAEPDLQALRRQRRADMGFAGEGGSAGWLPLGWVV
jgi:hypothetical protein